MNFRRRARGGRLGLGIFAKKKRAGLALIGAVWLSVCGAAAAPLVVAIDPGHGGRDIGASRAGVQEASLMLDIGLELFAVLERDSRFTPVLTRHDDSFVPLSARVAVARAQGAGVLLSLHADALVRDAASGVSVYVLSPDGADAASARIVARHGRDDLVAGVQLRGQDDALARVLMDLARRQTGSESARLADALIDGLGQAGARLNARPRREAALAVLAAPDMPAVLLELGFLSNPEDRAALQSARGRASLIAGIVLGLGTWAGKD